MSSDSSGKTKKRNSRNSKMEQEIKMLKGTVKKLQKSLSTNEKLFEQLDSRVDKKLEFLKKKLKEKDNQIKELEKNSRMNAKYMADFEYNIGQILKQKFGIQLNYNPNERFSPQLV